MGLSKKFEHLKQLANFEHLKHFEEYLNCIQQTFGLVSMQKLTYSRPVNGGTYDNCGGVLLSSDTVLTGAHCTLDGSEVVVGEYDRSKPDGEQRISIKEIIRHPIWM